MLQGMSDDEPPACGVIEPDTTIELTIEERVDNGWRWLEENFPGWQDRIDRGTLDLAGSQHCICGQVFADAVEANPRACGDNGISGYWFAYRSFFTEANSWVTALVGQDPTQPVVIPESGELSGWTHTHEQRAGAVAVSLGFLADGRLDAHTDRHVGAHDALQAEWQYRLDEYDAGGAIPRF
jgi:hypothetical protein